MSFVRDFVLDWNRMHVPISFSLCKAAGSNRPINVEVRYPEIEQFGFLHDDAWVDLNRTIEEKSNGLMAIATSAHLFRMGIIDIKIASRRTNYNEYVIVETLRWLGQEFFRCAKE